MDRRAFLGGTAKVVAVAVVVPVLAAVRPCRHVMKWDSAFCKHCGLSLIEIVESEYPYDVWGPTDYTGAPT